MPVSIQKNPSTTPTQNVVAIAVFLIALCLIGLYAWLLPIIQKAQSTLAQDQSIERGLQTDIENLHKAGEVVQKGKDNLAALGITPQTLGQVIPVDEQIPQLYIQMENITHNQPNLANVTYQIANPTTDVDNSVKIPVTFNAIGTYLNLKAYLKTLETNIRPVSLTTISLTPLQAKDAAIALTSAGKGLPGKNFYSLTAAGFVRALALSPAYTPTK